MNDDREKIETPVTKPVSRRDFLKMAGIAGVTLGAGAGLGGLLTACGEEGTGTTTSSGTGGETTSSVETGAEMAGELKCGYVIPLTGAMAAFGAAGKWQTDWFNENVWKDGLVCGDGKKYKITCILGDSQSDSNRSSQVASDLILNDGVTIIGSSSSAANVIPVRDMAESLECPGIHYDVPGDAWQENAPDGGFKWNWCAWWVGKDLVGNFVKMWETIPTNGTVGALWVNDADGMVFANALPGLFEELGLTLVDPGRFEPNTEDYSAIISQFKKEGVELVCGMANPPEFANFWKQSAQQSFRPKIVTCAKAMLFPAGVEALGDLGDGMTVECWYHPKYPYTSTVTGMTAQGYCDAFEAATGQQWTQPICFIGTFELWTDVLQRTTDPTDKKSIVEAIKQTKITTTGGPVDWTINPEPRFGFWNFCSKPLGGGQWVKGKGKYKYDMEIVASVTDTAIPTTATMKAVSYPS